MVPNSDDFIHWPLWFLRQSVEVVGVFPGVQAYFCSVAIGFLENRPKLAWICLVRSSNYQVKETLLFSQAMTGFSLNDMYHHSKVSLQSLRLSKAEETEEELNPPLCAPWLPSTSSRPQSDPAGSVSLSAANRKVNFPD